MYLLWFIVATALAIQPDDYEKCEKIFRYSKCCKSDDTFATTINDTNANTRRECFQIPLDNCERDRCIAMKSGFASSAGTINWQGLLEHLQVFLANKPELLAAVKENCLESDIDAYGLSDTCDYTKFTQCLIFQNLKLCKEFYDRKDCEDLNELVEECAELF